MLSYTMRAGFQCFWLSALAKFVSGDPSGAEQVENASLKTPPALTTPVGCGTGHQLSVMLYEIKI
jgi:hypothetical protein